MPVQASKNTAPYKPKKGEAYMNPSQLEHFRGILNEIKLGLSQDIDRTVHTMQDEATVFADPNALIGLPLILLVGMLEKQGVRVL